MSVVGAPVVVPMDSAERWHRLVLGWAHPLSADNSERVGADTKFLFDRRDPQNVIKIQAGDWLGSGTGYYLCARAPAEGMEMDVDNASIH